MVADVEQPTQKKKNGQQCHVIGCEGPMNEGERETESVCVCVCVCVCECVCVCMRERERECERERERVRGKDGGRENDSRYVSQ